MEHPKNLFEYQLRMYANLYFIIGLIETELRQRIMITLSDFAAEKGYSEWIETVPRSIGNDKSIHRAFRKNRNSWNGIEKYLSFSFWRHLFDGGNYTTLWIPALHAVFPSLADPLSWKSFSQVGNHMARANRIRNQIAHYNFHTTNEYESEKKILMWLLYKMDWSNG